MKTYIGTKIIQAEPQAKNYGPSEGQGAPGYKVVYPDGYTSWSPADAFEGAYRGTDAAGLTFGDAIHLLKLGHRVARAGWNGKGMWLSLSCDGSREVAAENFWSPHNAAHAHSLGGKAVVQPCITMKNAQGEIQMGWVATQSDMLAEDWMVLAAEA